MSVSQPWGGFTDPGAPAGTPTAQGASLAALLEAHGLEQYSAAFLKEGFDDLCDVEVQDVDHIVSLVGHNRKLKRLLHLPRPHPGGSVRQSSNDPSATSASLESYNSSSIVTRSRTFPAPLPASFVVPDEYIQGVVVSLDETQVSEFKDYNLANDGVIELFHKTVCKTLNAFINSMGGVMFFGIDDAAVVKGLRAPQEVRDATRRAVDAIVAKFYPAVDVATTKYAVHFVPVVPFAGGHACVYGCVRSSKTACACADVRVYVCVRARASV